MSYTLLACTVLPTHCAFLSSHSFALSESQCVSTNTCQVKLMREETMSSFEPVSLSKMVSVTIRMLSLVWQASASSSVKGHAVGDLL